jgi:hypothetical protein
MDMHDERRLEELQTAVTVDVVVECIDDEGRLHPMPTAFGFDPDDPFAVTITFRTPADDLPWTFGRDLLMAGLNSATGMGDVRVWPSRDERGRSIVMIEFSSPDGHLLTQVDATEVAGFLALTVAAVPPGAESALLDLDDLVGRLLDA